MGFRQHDTCQPGVIDNVCALVWLIMATGHVKARSLSVRSLALGSHRHTRSGWW
jgi:hypothetical protein